MKQSYKRLWRLGIDFRDAWKLASSEEEIDKIQGCISTGFTDENSSSMSSFFKSITQAIGDPMGLANTAELLDDKRDSVLTDLFNSDLTALSLNEYRKYVPVPEEFWDFAIPEWDNNSAYDDNILYSDLKIITYEMAPELAQKRKPGRPSYRQILYATIRILENEQVLNIQSATHKEIAREIRAYTKANNPDAFIQLDNADESTIRKHVTNYRNSKK